MVLRVITIIIIKFIRFLVNCLLLPFITVIYIFIHHNMIERIEQKVQKNQHTKKKKITTMEQVTQIYI